MKKGLLVVLVSLLMIVLVSSPLQSAEKIVVSVTNATQTDDVLYLVNADGTGQQVFFSFRNHPKFKNGRILDLAVDRASGRILFSSDHAYLFTPAGFNIFSLSADGRQLKQLTPGPYSGKWDGKCPCGTVTGTVKRRDGLPYSGAPVFLEGVGMMYAKGDGSFRFDNVPEGQRWLVAYKPGATVFDSQVVAVARGTTAMANMVPVSDFRANFQAPRYAQGRLYYRYGHNMLNWTGNNNRTYKNVYTAQGACSGMCDLDGFDVGSRTGRLAIMDYQDGCPTNRGLYIADKDGGNLRLLVDMKADNRWCGAQEVYWSPDETKLAFKACFNWQTCIFVINAANGTVLGYMCAPNSNYSLYNIGFYGWNSSGNKLMYSMHQQPTHVSLAVVNVQPNGTVDYNSTRVVAQNAAIVSAAWFR